MTSKCAIGGVILFALALLTHSGFGVVEARRNQGSPQRKTSSSSNSGHVTQPSYNTHSNGNSNGGGSSNSHADVAKLSYSNYNSQPNRPPQAAAGGSNTNTNNAPIGWNVPQGPPPAYSASNPAGGARTNLHEQPPAYHAPNYGAAPPPSYGGASNVHQPITATQNHGQQYAGVPPGATYYQSPQHVPGYQAGGAPGYYHPGAAAAPPPGATYYQAGAALPPGATYYAQPPQQQSSGSGLGFGTGLLAGGLGGALLGHALTPTGGSSSQPAAAAPAAPAAAGGTDRIIIINNGVPMNASDAAAVINANGTVAQNPEAAPAPLAPFGTNMTTNGTDPAAAAPPPPPAGGIVCVPTKVNETDPADSSKMIEVEKIACYPAPPPPAAAAGEGPAPLAPMAPVPAPGSQQMNQPAVLPPDQAAVRSVTSKAAQFTAVHQGGLFALVALMGLVLRPSIGF